MNPLTGKRRARAGFVLLLIAFLQGGAFGQSISLPGTGSRDAPANTDAVTDVGALSNALASLQVELAELGTNTTDRLAAQKLEQIKAAIEERLALLEDTDASQYPTITNLPPIPTLGDQPPPYPLETVDELRHARRVRTKSLESLRVSLEAAQAESAEADERLKARAQSLRALADNAEPQPDRAQIEAELRLDVRLAEQQAALQRLQLRQLRTTVEQIKQQRETAEEQLAAVGRNIAFDASRLEATFFALARREDSLQRSEASATFLLQRAESAAAEDPLAALRITGLRLEIDALQERLEMVPTSREAWQRRYDLYHRDVETAERLEWRDQAIEEVERLERTLRLRRLQQEEWVSAKRDDNDNASDDERARIAARTTDAYEGLLSALQRATDLHLNLREDHDLLHGRGLAAAEATERIRKVVDTVWNFEIAALDDRSITVKKVIYALALILIGVKLARVFSHTVVNRVLGRLRVEASSATAVATILFYLLAILVCVSALGMAGIPLTLFTLMGGALAIGIGFGSQNILNNFISGLILLVERPIRVGDMVEIGGTYGRIDRVGLRCTRVRSFDNVDILVPNSSFLESNVINWTLSDDRTRGALFIGVAYGSPTERVREIMREAAAKHPNILRTPAPEVMFMDFGDNALSFRMHVWVRMRSLSDRDRVLSDLRFRIDATFRQENITIAFPQRDVHLTTLAPLDVRVMPPDRTSS